MGHRFYVSPACFPQLNFDVLLSFLTVGTSKLNVSPSIFPVDFELINIFCPEPRRLCGSTFGPCHFNRYVSLAYGGHVPVSSAFHFI